MSDTILIVDDTEDIRLFLQEALQTAGYQTLSAADGEEAFRLVQTAAPDLVMLDIMLPGLNGFQVLRKIRETSAVPVIMISARGDTVDKVESFQYGADDYITKPFELAELTARVAAVLRRFQQAAPFVNEQSRVDCSTSRGELVVNNLTHRVTLAGKYVPLSDTEFKLLWEIARNNGHIVTYRELLAKIWGKTFTSETNYLHTYIHALRAKIEPDPDKPRYLITVAKVGYRFDREQ